MCRHSNKNGFSRTRAGPACKWTLLWNCGALRAFGGFACASRGTSAASMFDEKLRADLSFLDYVIALRALHFPHTLSLPIPVRS